MNNSTDFVLDFINFSHYYECLKIVIFQDFSAWPPFFFWGEVNLITDDILRKYNYLMLYKSAQIMLISEENDTNYILVFLMH